MRGPLALPCRRTQMRAPSDMVRSSRAVGSGTGNRTLAASVPELFGCTRESIIRIDIGVAELAACAVHFDRLAASLARWTVTAGAGRLDDHGVAFAHHDP